jgi:hypothetical protein
VTCLRAEALRRASVAIRRKRSLRGEARGNLKSSLALLGTRLHGVYPERTMRFFASLRMTKSEGFAMTPREWKLIYGVHFSLNI